ncbi:MAG: hypothetical protein MJ252_19680 [archaeon]|nr:hypothetical protein [archaeon]
MKNMTNYVIPNPEKNLDEYINFTYVTLTSPNLEDTLVTKQTIESFKNLISNSYSDYEKMQTIFNSISKAALDESNRIKDKEAMILYPIIFSVNPKESYKCLTFLYDYLIKTINDSNRALFSFTSQIFGQVISSLYSTNTGNNSKKDSVPIVLSYEVKVKIFEEVLSFCTDLMSKDHRNEQICGCLYLTEFIENCALSRESAYLKKLWEIIAQFLDSQSFIAKIEILNCIISLIFTAEKLYKPYANVTLFKILDFLTDTDWMKRKLALNIVYTLSYYCKEEILHLKSHIVEFLNILKNDKVSEVREVCLQTLNFLEDSQEDNNEDIKEDKEEDICDEEIKNYINEAKEFKNDAPIEVKEEKKEESKENKTPSNLKSNQNQTKKNNLKISTGSKNNIKSTGNEKGNDTSVTEPSKKTETNNATNTTNSTNPKFKKINPGNKKQRSGSQVKQKKENHKEDHPETDFTQPAPVKKKRNFSSKKVNKSMDKSNQSDNSGINLDQIQKDKELFDQLEHTLEERKVRTPLSTSRNNSYIKDSKNSEKNNKNKNSSVNPKGNKKEENPSSGAFLKGSSSATYLDVDDTYPGKSNSNNNLSLKNKKPMPVKNKTNISSSNVNQKKIIEQPKTKPQNKLKCGVLGVPPIKTQTENKPDQDASQTQTQNQNISDRNPNQMEFDSNLNRMSNTPNNNQNNPLQKNNPMGNSTNSFNPNSNMQSNSFMNTNTNVLNDDFTTNPNNTSMAKINQANFNLIMEQIGILSETQNTILTSLATLRDSINSNYKNLDTRITKLEEKVGIIERDSVNITDEKWEEIEKDLKAGKINEALNLALTEDYHFFKALKKIQSNQYILIDTQTVEDILTKICILMTKGEYLQIMIDFCNNVFKTAVKIKNTIKQNLIEVLNYVVKNRMSFGLEDSYMRKINTVKQMIQKNCI